MPERLYEDDDLVAFWNQGTSDHILVTFGDALDVASGERFFADTPARKADISCIGIMARQPNWYPVNAIERLAPVIRPRLAAAPACIGYGGSMGGFAAVKHSARLGLTHAIALCPQWSIDAEECDGHDPGFQHWYRPEMEGHHVRPEEVAGLVVLMFDPRDPIDGFHGERLQAAAPSARTIPVWNVGHHVTKTFAGTANLTEMIAAVRDGDMGRLGRFAARLRRESPERAQIVLSSAARTHPRLAARALRNPASSRRNVVGHPGDYLLPLLARLLGIGAERDAGLVAEAIADRHREGLEAADLLLLRHELRHQRAVRLGTFHRTVVVYDVVRGRLRHIPPEEPAARTEDILPVLVEMSGSRADLFVVLQGRRFRLEVLPDGFCRPVATHHATARHGRGAWSVERDPLRQGNDRQIGLCQSSFYLCAVPGQLITVNRQTISDWECFDLSIED